MEIPQNFKNKLSEDYNAYKIVLDSISLYKPILEYNNQFFFEEYTNHGIEHIENILKVTDIIITKESFKELKPMEIAIFILSVILHDIAMQIEFPVFKSMINGGYDNFRQSLIDDKTWNQLWKQYLLEINHLDSKAKKNVLGSSNYNCDNFSIDKSANNLTEIEKKLIGEFIRRYHCRLAQEIALAGLIVESEKFELKLDAKYKQVSGIIARSHGMKIRDTFAYLEEIGYGNWKNPNGINIIFLMILLRISDYLQIDNTRTSELVIQLKEFGSHYSKKEHQLHLAVEDINFTNDNPEVIYVTGSPLNSTMYIKLKDLICDIQNELDTSWAILGEVYGGGNLKIKYRRIVSNLEHEKFLNKITYVPEKISFKTNNDLSKLLIAPLYGNNPKYGVRELVQNATDACKERNKTELERKKKYYPKVVVTIDTIDNSFKITDNGKGMTKDEIINYYLNIGASLKNSKEWEEKYSNNSNYSVNRVGEFGIGVLASFLIGDEIEVKTKSLDDKYSYYFKARFDSDLIEVNRKVDNKEIGTEILIKLSNKSIHYFNTNNDSVWNIRWCDWYVEDFPIVEYYLNGKKVIPHNFFSTHKVEKNMHIPNICDIIWYPRYYSNYRGYSVSCNNIMVSHNNDKKNVFPSFKINNLNHNGLVNLDRTNIDISLFKDKLIIENYKDLIARILTINNFRHLLPFMNFLLAKDGFCINLKYFTSKLKTNIVFPLSLRRLLFREKNFYNDLLSNDYFISLYAEADTPFWKEININYQIEGIKGYILCNKLNDLLKINSNSLRFDNMETYDQYELYRVYNTDIDISECKMMKNISSFIKFLNSESHVKAFIELPPHIYNVEYDDIIDDLFCKYIGDDILIPYDLNKRREKYPLAFSDLKDYMDGYDKLEFK